MCYVLLFGHSRVVQQTRHERHLSPGLTCVLLVLRSVLAGLEKFDRGWHGGRAFLWAEVKTSAVERGSVEVEARLKSRSPPEEQRMWAVGKAKVLKLQEFDPGPGCRVL